nr:MAG TPA: Bcl-2-like protein [Caudoviricetes sp.]
MTANKVEHREARPKAARHLRSMLTALVVGVGSFHLRG